MDRWDFKSRAQLRDEITTTIYNMIELWGKNSELADHKEPKQHINMKRCSTSLVIREMPTKTIEALFHSHHIIIMLKAQPS